MDANIEELKGKTIIRIDGMKENSDEIDFYTSDGSLYQMYHHQECCESVFVEDICGDIEDLIGVPLLVAEERESSENPQNIPDDIIRCQESFTWTFYHFETQQGYVDLRWYGESNGYYSESVDFSRIEK